MRTALVPTMGYFHAGHLSLMQWARENAEKLYVSLFINPKQFGPSEDLDSYPSDIDRDTRLARETGCDVLFMPEPQDIYPEGHSTVVDVPELSRHLCGASRPGHFKGVATVVSVLLNLALPSLAVFGEKDRQQLAVIRRMAADLHLPTEIVGRPIVREPGGLAMSSRNAYLSPEERSRASHVYRGLVLGREKVRAGEDDAARIEEAILKYYRENLSRDEIDYVSVVDEKTMQPAEKIKPGAIAAVAVRIGKARLIDNMTLTEGAVS
jgi:pantoate--beta-alanine ligase